VKRDARKGGGRRSLEQIVRGYDRVARIYARFEPLFLIFPPARRRAVAALRLAPGMTVLEIGAGTGRNLPYLLDAVGPTGTVIAVDASPGMLAEARRLIDGHGWSNVRLLQQDAARLEVDVEPDAVLFSFSYSALPDPQPALERAWERLRPGGRVVVMDVGLTHGRFHRLLAPVGRLLEKLGPGDAFSEPWDDLAACGSVETEFFMAGFYYVSWVEKPGEPVACSLGAADLEGRLAAIAAVGADSLVAREMKDGRHLLRFRDDGSTRRRLEEIVAAEARCCSFLDLALRDEDGDLVLSIAAPAEGQTVADGLAAAFGPSA
jgi:demethylmenaquinone methyltransferase/2-methoxy-6-polyprenyl-1,4-benzoquinol methylase